MALVGRSELNSVEEVCGMMGKSSLLVAEPVGTKQNVLIPCYDWQAKFSSVGKIAGLKKFTILHLTPSNLVYAWSESMQCHQ